MHFDKVLSRCYFLITVALSLHSLIKTHIWNHTSSLRFWEMEELQSTIKTRERSRGFGCTKNWKTNLRNHNTVKMNGFHSVFRYMYTTYAWARSQWWVIFPLSLHLHVKLTCSLQAQRTLKITFEYWGKQNRKLHSQQHINQILFKSHLVVALSLFTLYICLKMFGPTLGQ